jgi:hypothetical protein
LSIAIASLIALVIFGVLAVLVLGRVFRAAADRNENRPGGGEEEEGGRDPTGDDPGTEKARRSMTRSFGWGLAALGILLAGAGTVSAFDEVSLNNVVPAAFVGGVLGARRLLYGRPQDRGDGGRRFGSRADVRHRGLPGTHPRDGEHGPQPPRYRTGRSEAQRRRTETRRRRGRLVPSIAGPPAVDAKRKTYSQYSVGPHGICGPPMTLRV